MIFAGDFKHGGECCIVVVHFGSNTVRNLISQVSILELMITISLA
jgi:hypothetical protein